MCCALVSCAFRSQYSVNSIVLDSRNRLSFRSSVIYLFRYFEILCAKCLLLLNDDAVSDPMIDLLETFRVLARAAAQMRDNQQAQFSFFCRSFFGTFLLVRFRKSGEVCINSVMWPARSHVTGCLEYQDEIFYEFSQPPLRFDDAMLTRNKVFNGESLMRGMERRIWQQTPESRYRLKEDVFFIAYKIVLLNG